MVCYRIGSPAFPLLDGAGAAASDGARWNSRGRHIVYAAEHYACALLEKAAQLNTIKIPRSLVFVQIEIPGDASVEEIQADDLPGWDEDARSESQRFGDAWYDEQRTLVLVVPSLVAPGLERNVLINQRHPAFTRIVASSPQPVRAHPRFLI